MKLWRKHLSLTFERNGNPYAWVRLGPVGVGFGNVDGVGRARPTYWLSERLKDNIVIRIPMHKDLGLLLEEDHYGELEQALRELAANAMSVELRRIWASRSLDS